MTDEESLRSPNSTDISMNSPSVEIITVKVQNQFGASVSFRTKRSSTMQKMFETYCQKKGLNDKTVRFIFDGVRLKNEHTFAEKGLADGDVIECWSRQHGG